MVELIRQVAALPAAGALRAFPGSRTVLTGASQLVAEAWSAVLSRAGALIVLRAWTASTTLLRAVPATLIAGTRRSEVGTSLTALVVHAAGTGWTEIGVVAEAASPTAATALIRAAWAWSGEVGGALIAGRTRVRAGTLCRFVAGRSLLVALASSVAPGSILGAGSVPAALVLATGAGRAEITALLAAGAFTRTWAATAT